jgi:signal transduction histidine kinase
MVESRLQPQVSQPVPAGSVELLGRAIHRVRNLMMSVRGYAELIAMSHLGDPDHRRWAGRIVEQVDRLEKLQSRVDGALREYPEVASHSLRMIARAAIERSNKRTQAGAALVDVVTRFHGDVDVQTDGEDLAEAVAALLDNAREASAALGDGAVVHLTARGREDGQWSLSIRDSGPGMANEDRNRLGEPFFTRKAGHLGLGLFLSRCLLDRHGMQLDFSVGSGGGTVATIRERRKPAGGHR